MADPRRHPTYWRWIGPTLGSCVVLLGLVVLALWAPAAFAADRRVVDGLATVQTDGSLHVGGETVWLYGVYFPADAPTTCRFAIRPPRCAARSVLALDYKVTGFVHCEIVGTIGDALAGFCSVAGRDPFGPRQDLGAAMIRDGWVLATPDAPPRYRALEGLARSREAGLWGDKIVNFR